MAPIDSIVMASIAATLALWDASIHIACIFRPPLWWRDNKMLWWPYLFGRTYELFWAAIHVIIATLALGAVLQ